MSNTTLNQQQSATVTSQSDPADAVQTIKSQFLDNSQKIVFGGEIQKTIPDDGKIQLFFKTLTNRTRVLRTKTDATILELKQAFFDSDGVPVDAQRLIWGGKELEDERTLQDYNIQQEATIYPVLRLRGGRKGSSGSQTTLVYSCSVQSSMPFFYCQEEEEEEEEREEPRVDSHVTSPLCNLYNRRRYRPSSSDVFRKSPNKPPGFRRRDFTWKRSGRDSKTARNEWGSAFNLHLFDDRVGISSPRLSASHVDDSDEVEEEVIPNSHPLITDSAFAEKEESSLDVPQIVWESFLSEQSISSEDEEDEKFLSSKNSRPLLTDSVIEEKEESCPDVLDKPQAAWESLLLEKDHDNEEEEEVLDGLTDLDEWIDDECWNASARCRKLKARNNNFCEKLPSKPPGFREKDPLSKRTFGINSLRHWKTYYRAQI